MSYEQTFFIVPTYIIKLPGITLAYLHIYETIFQFWNHGKECFLSNRMIMERTGISSERTVHEAFLYFEKHGELIRKSIDGQRYLVKPERKINITDKNDEKELVHTPALECAPPPQCNAPPPRTGVRHNINNINIKKNNKIKNSCSTDVEPTKFDQFWSLYPRKQKRKDAIKIWSKRNLDEKADEIQTHLMKRLEGEWKTKSTEYIPLPSTFLNGERWNDDISTQNFIPKKETQKEMLNRFYQRAEQLSEGDSSWI